MKNPVFYLISFILIFLGCLGISKVVENFYSVNGDYLSAFATFAAGTTAFFLIVDWREQHRIEHISFLKNELRQNSIDLSKAYNSIFLFLDIKKGKNNEDYSNNIKDKLVELIYQLDKAKFLLLEYLINIRHLNVKSIDIQIEAHLAKLQILFDSIDEFNNELENLIKENEEFYKLNFGIINLINKEAKGFVLYSYKFNISLYLNDFYTILMNYKKGK